METSVRPNDRGRRRGLALQIKVSALVVVALGSLAIAIGLGNYLYFRSVLKVEATSRGKAISATIASVKKDANLAYVEVVGPNGNVIAHTFDGRIPQQDTAVLRDSEKIRDVVLDGVSYIDVPAAVITGAVVHVGLDPAAGNAMVLRAQKLLGAITLAALVAAAFISLMLVARFVAPLRNLTRAARRIVDGDLTQEIEVTTNDEVGQLAAGFAQMVEKMKEVLRALQESVQLLANAGGELSQSTNDQSQTITRQATALQETQVTAQEIKQTSLLAAQKAETVLKLTEKADQVSSQGEEAIEKSLGGLTDIRAQVDEIAQKIAQLSERTQQIGGITQTVKDLADQSNMLGQIAAAVSQQNAGITQIFSAVTDQTRMMDETMRRLESTTQAASTLKDLSQRVSEVVGRFRV